MGSSARKKREKKKDFQQPKLKVGKAKPKAANTTNTSFKSKSIVLKQALIEKTLDSSQLFKRQFDLITSKTDKQRHDALAYIVGQLSDGFNPIGISLLVKRLNQLISDSSKGVRELVLRAFKTIAAKDMTLFCSETTRMVHMAMVDLRTDVKNDALGFLEWLLDTVEEEFLQMPGGWKRTLTNFLAAIGWLSYLPSQSKSDGWSKAPTTTFGARSGSALYSKQVMALNKFLAAGLRPEIFADPTPHDIWQASYGRAKDSHAFRHIWLGPAQNKDDDMCQDREGRQEGLAKYQEAIMQGADAAIKEGGAVGRAAKLLRETIVRGMEDYETVGF